MSQSQTWPSGTDRILLDTVDSTMAEASRRASGLEYPTWILARHQTSARGRRGRKWENPAGNFAATLVLKPEGGPGDAALRSFVAANALYETLARKVDKAHLSLKWPNDVLLDGRKVAGILLESSGSGGHLDWLAIGIGVNLVETPPSDPDVAFAPISLADVTGNVISPESFLDDLALHFAEEEARFQAEGFEPVRLAWLSRAARLGEEITARTTREEFVGTFQTIDETGQLVLLGKAGQVAIPAADVFF